MRGKTIKNVEEIKDRLLQRMRVDKKTNCWMWQKYISPDGYARTCYQRFFPNVTGAHRISYSLFRGPIPEGMVIDHLCRTRSCINPDHMEVVTAIENNRRGIYPTHTHRNGRKTHCKRGHPFNKKNTIMVQGSRQCRACIYKKNLRRYYANRDEINAQRKAKRKP